MRSYFNPRSPRRERRLSTCSFVTRMDFNPRSPRRERPRLPRCWRGRRYFNPRSPRRERPDKSAPFGWRISFQSTLPAKGATCRCRHVVRNHADFNPRSPRRERLSRFHNHPKHKYFNPRSPRRERRRYGAAALGCTRFQSTLPAKGATRGRAAGACGRVDFNPRSPRRERLGNAR